MRYCPLAFALATLLAALSLPCRAADAPADPAFQMNQRLGRGVNIIGYDPLWRDRTKARFQAEHFRLIREAGFNHVRINLHPFRDCKADSTQKLTEPYLQTLDWALDQALANKLLVIVDFHEFQSMGNDPEGKKESFLGIWRQLAEHCKARPGEVVFEILNEPHGKLTPKLWNQYLREALAIIRKTNPTRTVIVGPGQWNNINQLADLQLPEDDRNLIVTVHYYSPFQFTHQGAPWANLKDKVGVSWDGTPEQRQAIDRDFDKAQDWAKAQRRPLYLGEFGVYDKAEMSSRVRWLEYVTRGIEKRGWSWGYWQFDGDFILYDIKNHKWVEPIRDAVVPAAKPQ